MSIKRILVPTDFSAPSDAAVALAASIARRCGAHMTILHIDPPPPELATIAAEPMYIPPHVFARLRRGHEEKLERDLDELRDRYGDQAEITTILRRTTVVEGIIGHACELEVDLIVMGSAGGGATRFLLGSHAAKVSRQAPCPVLVVPDGEWLDIDRVLVAIDYSRFSTPATQFAAQLLGPEGQIELMHAWYEPYLAAFDRTLGPRGELANVAVEGRNRQANLLSMYAKQEELPAVASCYIGSGNPPRAILSRAEETGADLIVVGAHSREGVVQHMLGTVADRVLRHSAIPVLLYPEDALAVSQKNAA